MQITEAQRMNFRNEGYFILENVIPFSGSGYMVTDRHCKL